MITALSVPNFALAAFLVWALAIRLHALPVAGWGQADQAVLPVLVTTRVSTVVGVVVWVPVELFSPAQNTPPEFRVEMSVSRMAKE